MADPRSILDESLSLPPAERPAFFEAQCAGDPELRRQVEALHREHFESAADSTVATPSDQTIETPPPPSVGARPGDRIGRYKLLQLIGEGGFGSVYMAEQTEPVTRRVALKIIKLGMDTKQVVARFEAERQALALMDHPNIAGVLDAGATEAGRPYFVMDLVRGVPITEYCDSNSLGLRERLELFCDVCGAVQHAHQKGIIHRDLKPSNILVTLHDVKAVPKVIDFGIAKATNQRLTEKTLFTEFRQFVGTPQYMSPEQAEMSGLDVDTRSDVYSLGAVLYELLTGATPFEAQALMSEGYAGMSQMIRDVDPPALDQRFTALGEERTTVAKRRGTEPDRWLHSLRGDLQWIVSKALEKDRTRRYESASQFADDIGRFLASEPILAVPPSAAYRLKKFVRRNRAWVATGAIVAVALSAGLAVATLGWVQANRELDRSRAMSAFLQELHIGFDPFRQSENTDVDTIVARCEELFGKDHAAVGSLLFTRASLLQSWGRLGEAEAVLERSLEFQRKSLGGDHEALAATLNGLGSVYSQQGRKAESRSAFEDALRIHTARFGEDSLQAGESAQNLAQLLIEGGDPAEQDLIEGYFEQAIGAFRAGRGGDDPRTIQLLCSYGLWLQGAKRTEDSLPILEEAIENGRQHRQSLGDLWLGALNSLAVAHILAGNDGPAARYYAEVIELLRERGMSGTSLIVQLLRYAAWLTESERLEGAERLDEAEEVLREALAIGQRDLPVADDTRRDALRSLITFLIRRDTEAARTESETLLRAQLAEVEAEFGEGTPERSRAREDLGRWLTLVGREDEAAEFMPPEEPAASGGNE